MIVSDAAHNAIRRLQLDAARACGANPALRQTPHVTLKQPFHARALEPVEDYFEELVQTVEPLEIHLRGLDTFPEDRVIFLGVEPEPRLEALRQATLRDLAERFRVRPRDVEDDRYRFHATISYNLSEGQHRAAWEALRDRSPDLRFTLHTLGLFYYTGDLWILYRRSRIPWRDVRNRREGA